MRSLPFYTVLLLSALVLVWNYSFKAIEPEEADLVMAAVRDGAGLGPAAVHSRSSVVADAVGEETNGLVTPDPRAARARARASAGEEPTSLGGGESRKYVPIPRSDGDDVPEDWMHDVETYSSGARRSAGYRAEGLRVGYWVEWFEDGEIKSEGAYQDDEPDGEWVYHHKTGGLHIRETYVGGELSGPRISWDRNGVLVEEGTFEGGRPVGEWVQWYSNGQVRSRGRFVDGKRTGDWEFYDFGGLVDIRTGRYLEGRRVED